MVGELNIFETYRWSLGIVCTIYAAVLTWQWLWGWLVWFGSSRPTAILGRYASLMVFRIRVLRFGWELAQIVGLLILFFYIVRLHYRLV